MIDFISVKALYLPALAEGEGVGTAYEYFAKRLVLRPWLNKQKKRPKTILMAGCPQKYGSNLDFVLLAAELGASLTVVDDRPEAVQKAQDALKAAQAERWLPNYEVTYTAVDTLTNLNSLDTHFDLVVSSEVLQRLSDDDRRAYVTEVKRVGTAVALFAPNGDNAAHTNLSGLAGLTLDQLTHLTPGWKNGYIDMPPFPPGMIRTDEQREQATSGLMEGIAMWGLSYYALLEGIIPTPIRRKQSHIVYALSPIKS